MNFHMFVDLNRLVFCILICWFCSFVGWSPFLYESVIDRSPLKKFNRFKAVLQTQSNVLN